MTVETAKGSLRRDVQILSIIGLGHGLSHFFLLALPPLFPLLKDAFNVNYAALGFLITVLNVATATTQLPAGMLVDRFGARGMLIGGLILLGGSIGLIGLADNYWMALVLVILAGIGNSVVHPVDYVILTTSVDQRRIGRAFSIHTFTGNVGFILAPVTMILLANLFGWRSALMVCALLAAVAASFLIAWGGLLQDPATAVRRKEPEKERPPEGAALYLNANILPLFFFFVVMALVTSGIHSFSVTALVDYQSLDLGAANTVLTGFLIASAAGILAGGPIADSIKRRAAYTIAIMCFGALLMALMGAFQLPFLFLLLFYVLFGLSQGTIRPIRDMMVRNAAPDGAIGRVFAFVSIGINVGAAISPLLLGFLIDLGRPELVFYLFAAFTLAGVLTVSIAKRHPRNSTISKPRFRSMR